MKKFFKRGLMLIALIITMTFSPCLSQNADAKKNDKGWICAGNEEFNIILFDDGTLYIFIYDRDGHTKMAVIYPDGSYFTPDYTENH